MKRILLLAAVCLLAIAAPTWASTCNCQPTIGCNGTATQCNGTPANQACIYVNAGVNAATLADCVGDAWGIGPFACNISQTNPDQLVITLTGSPDQKTVEYVIDTTTTPNPHTYKQELVAPVGTGSPFSIMVNYDGAGFVEVRDGTTTFPDITLVVSTQPASATAVPMLDGKRVGLFVLGLVGAGIAFIFLRRR